MTQAVEITHEVTIYLTKSNGDPAPFVFRGSYDEVVKVRERYINLYVSTSGVREVEDDA